MMHLLPVIWAKEKHKCPQFKGCGVSRPANERDVNARKYYHNALTHCDGQRRNESVHIAKHREQEGEIVIISIM